MAQLKDYTSICSSGTSEYLSIVALRNKEKVLQRNLDLARSNLALLDKFFEEFSDVLSWVSFDCSPSACLVCAKLTMLMAGATKGWSYRIPTAALHPQTEKLSCRCYYYAWTVVDGGVL